MLSMIFGPDLVVVLVFLAVIFGLLALSIFAIVDISSHSREDFYVAGYSKTAWILVIAVATVCTGFGALVAVYYLIAARPKVLRVEAAGRTYAPPQSGAHGGTGSFCSNCGAAASGAGKYCSSCGTPIAV
jgi:hypothetical protein